MKKNKYNFTKRKQIIAQSILWASAMLTVSILDNKEFVLLILIILSSVSLFIFKTQNIAEELTNAVDKYEKKNKVWAETIKNLKII
jgi:hypothetical protein